MDSPTPPPTTPPGPPTGPPAPPPPDLPSGRPPWRDAAASAREAARRTAQASATAGRATRRTVRRATHAQGAGETGMAKLTELSGVNAAGDTLVTVALAGTLFFSVPVGEARGRVALYLLITMIPFALLAPLIGPLLDRFRAGRRYAFATIFGARAFLCWSMTGAVADADLWLYPAVFGVLIGGRAYGVTRAACVPRLLPPTMPLVRANSWMNMAGLAASGVAVAAGIAVTQLAGAEWGLRLAAVVFAGGVVLSLRLPKRIDSAADERPAAMSDERSAGPVETLEAAAAATKARARYVGPAVEMGLRANMAFRALSGFLTLFLAFLLRQDPIGGLDDTTAIGLVIGAAAVGSVLGTSVGALLRERAPEAMLVLLLILETAVILTTTVWWGVATVLAAGLIVGLGQTLGKLGLDAMIQRDVDEDVRSSAFARSETRLQLAWVAGGALGIALPLRGDVGFGIAGGAMVVGTVLVIANLRGVRRGRRSGSRAGGGHTSRFEAPVPSPAPRPQSPDAEASRPDAPAPDPASLPFPPTAAQRRHSPSDG